MRFIDCVSLLPVVVSYDAVWGPYSTSLVDCVSVNIKYGPDGGGNHDNK